jgi:hypothetical protein
MSSQYREPRLEEMLADPIIKAVMEADGVDSRALEAELQRTAALLHATRRVRTVRSSRKGRDHMRYQIVVWSAIAWIAVCLAPYLYALNDLITWR